MKRSLFLLIIVFIAANSFAQQIKHVVVISVDGLRPDFYLDSSWHANNIRALMKDGVYARGVNSVFPSMTYPSHTTIVTGVQPAHHGIYYNAVFEPQGSTGKIYWNDSSIKAFTIWTAAQNKGLKVASLLWPVSADAPVMYNIPDIGSMGEGIREQYSKPSGFVNELKTNVFNGASKIDYGKNINVARIAAYVIQKDQPNLMTIHFFSVDHAEHLQGRDGDMVKEAVADADSGVAIIIAALKEAHLWDHTAIIVTGDHGFVNVNTVLNPNVWLANAGLIKNIKNSDRQAQFFTVGGSAYLYVKNHDRHILDQVIKILDGLPENEKQYIKVIDRKKLNAIEANPDVELALSGLNGASFGGAFEGPDMKEGHGGTHGFIPDFREIQTGFVAYGPGISKGVVIPEMNLRDIAPVVARLLGLSFQTAEGKVPAGLFIK
ncbi:MAG TPA: ectonucleotide pyrophosphatase/phosphodiesterase [Flavisolibacter sp.]|nr:ectonucleotide pyrophosphatase/phosphodiesterase [Flavisolibacter sp.]